MCNPQRRNGSVHVEPVHESSLSFQVVRTTGKDNGGGYDATGKGNGGEGKGDNGYEARQGKARVPLNCLLSRFYGTGSPDVEFKMHCRGVEIWDGQDVGAVMTSHGIG